MPACPRCRQPLPEPPERFCPSCGAELTAAPAGTPWERRGEIGLVTALTETTTQVLTRTTDFYRAMPVTGGLGSPLLYGVIVGYVGLLAAAVYGAIFQALMGPGLLSLPHRGELDRFLPYVQGGIGIVVQVVLGPVMVAVGLFLFAAIVHLVLLLIGGAQRGFEATFRVGCYAEATALLRVVPLCGGMIATVYFIVVAIVGLSEAHGISKGKAATAILLPLVLVCCCCGALIALVVGGFASALGNLK
jgi:hypothetical protein